MQGNCHANDKGRIHCAIAIPTPDKAKCESYLLLLTKGSIAKSMKAINNWSEYKCKAIVGNDGISKKT